MSFLLLLVFSFTAWAQPLTVSQYQVLGASAQESQLLQQYFDVDAKPGSILDIYITPDQAGLLTTLAPQVKLIALDTSLTNSLLARPVNSVTANESYKTYPEVLAWINQKVADHPALATAINYGKSQQGRDLMALRVKAKPGNLPVLMITSATHGDELITTEVLIRLFDKLFSQYGTDSRLTQILDRHDIYFIPVVNPDGFSNRVRWDNSGDPNRSYPYPQNTSANPTVSIAALIAFFHKINPVASIDYHAYGGMIMYPWAYTYDPIDSKDAQALDALTKSMAEINNYSYGPISKVIYVAKGSSCDYYYWKNHTSAVAIEIGDQKIPPANTIPKYVESQQESLWRFMEKF